MEGVLTPRSLLIPAFALLCAPPVLAIGLLGAQNAPLPCDLLTAFTASVRRLSLAELSAPPHSTSELLRTLSMMAASKPTSWLSVRSDFL